jgi:hypothetical protein
MGAPRRKGLIAHKRRTDDDGEEDGDIVATIEDDSSSQGSLISDLEDDADAEGSESSEVAAPHKTGPKRKNGDKKGRISNGQDGESTDAKQQSSITSTMADTEAMMNGMNIQGNGDDVEEIQFDSPAATTKPVESVLGNLDGLGDRKRQEHEEYKKQRDANPAFVPNRGGFFMHDHRSSAPGQNGFRPSGRGRGRGGRGGVGAPIIPLRYVKRATALSCANIRYLVATTLPRIQQTRPGLTTCTSLLR